LDPGDAHWSAFRVWRDTNQDGIVESGELHTLDELGITSINLQPTGDAVHLADGSSVNGI